MMNKISGILPSTPRITTVDLSMERPVRRTSPDFGIPFAPSSRTDFRSVVNEVDTEEAALRDAQIVKESSEGFFIRPTSNDEVIGRTLDVRA